MEEMGGTSGNKGLRVNIWSQKSFRHIHTIRICKKQTKLDGGDGSEEHSRE